MCPFCCPCRLPKLDFTALDVCCNFEGSTLPTAMLLCSLRTVVTGLRYLEVSADASWAASPICMKELGEFTQLTELHVAWPEVRGLI